MVYLPQDNCRDTYNPDQEDSDVDDIGDKCDNCEYQKNEDQKNNDGDEEGDVCDSDDDNDRVCKLMVSLYILVQCSFAK